MIGWGETATALETPRDRLLATGQAWGYAGDRGERVDGNGDDGDLVSGRATKLSYADVITPTTQSENVVVDLNTGLMWVRQPRLLVGTNGDAGDEAIDGNVSLSQAMDWQAALDAVANLNYAGHDDWSLPTINELETIVDFGRAAPALDSQVFGESRSGELDYIWSSTTNPRSPDEAFYLNRNDGHIYPWQKPWHLSVMAVRVMAVADPVAIFQSGQKASYVGNAGSVGSGSADDGTMQHGLTSNFEFADDGEIDTPAENTVIDRQTGLAWLRDPRLVRDAAGRLPLDMPMGWQAAVSACANLDFDNHDDWRLPNIRELWSLVRPGDPTALFDSSAFPGAPISRDPTQALIWWSSTTLAGDHTSERAGDSAWFVSTMAPAWRHHSATEFRPPKTRPGFVRCVRDASLWSPPDSWRPEVRGSDDWQALSITIGRPDNVREGKWLAAVSENQAPFDTAFQDALRFPLHLDFLRAAFPDRYAGLTPEDYEAITAHRVSRRLFAGSIRSFLVNGTLVYGFDVYTADSRPEELLTLDETLGLYRRLTRVFRRRPLVYSPLQPEARAAAVKWEHPGLPVGWPTNAQTVSFEPYTRGVAYGTIRRLTQEELMSATKAGGLSWQDIVVVDRAPTDIAQIVAAVITGEQQGPLSHLNVRLSRRGTPNAFVADSHAAFASHDGKLVRLEVDDRAWRVTSGVPLGDAEAWWSAHRPRPVVLMRPDYTFLTLDDLSEIATSDVVGDSERDASVRFGGKTANLARLYKFLPLGHQVPGFGIPLAHYAAYMRANTAPDPRVPGGRPVPLVELLATLHMDSRFNSDSSYRAPLLASMRKAIDDNGVVPPALIAMVGERIGQVFGPTTMVRFRSSSNAEDGVAFNGAGLYDSTSVCAADSFDSDSAGPSRCDSAQLNERTIERGLRRVWSSLWSQRGWEERAHYGIDPARIAMAVLVTPAFPDERANGVAFSGDPVRPEVAGEMVINAQYGDASVVLPEGGDLPERSVVLHDGRRVTGLRRIQPSNRVLPGSQVLSDAEVLSLGELLLLAREKFPLGVTDIDRNEVMFDVEWKVRRGDNALIIKQIRPFVPASTVPRVNEARLVIPEQLSLCTMWRPSSPPERELADKRVLLLNPGESVIRLDESSGQHGLFGTLSDGDATPAEAANPGQFVLKTDPSRPNYRQLSLTRQYRLAERLLEVRVRSIDLPAEGLSLLRLDGNALTSGSTLVTLADITDDSDQRTNPAPEQLLGPCGLPVLPRQRYDLRLADGGRAVFVVRKGRGFFSYRWATLVAATVSLPAGRTEVRDVGRLVYSASRHNWSEQFLALFDPPLGEVYGLQIVHDGANSGEGTYTALYLDSDLQSLEVIPVESLAISPLPSDGPEYRIALPWIDYR